MFHIVYTTTTPRAINISASTVAMASNLTSGTPNKPTIDRSQSEPAKPEEGPLNLKGSAERTKADGATPSPLNTTPPTQKTNSVPTASLEAQAPAAGIPQQRSISMVQQRQEEDSPVMNETLSVIDEHITDMKMPRANGRSGERRMTNDSGSEYSTHIDQRLSYIAGHETDEEERSPPTEREMLTWTPSQVAEYLEDIGVERRHCEIFREQEISGEVLLAMDQSSIFMKEFDLGLVGRRLRTWHKIKALQDEIRGPRGARNKTTNLFDGDGSSEEYDPGKGVSNGSMLTSSPFDQPPAGRIYPRQVIPSPQPSPSIQQLHSQRQDAFSTPASFTFKSGVDSPSRPSAASIRELNHSRRHSAIDFASSFSPVSPPEQHPPSTPPINASISSHQKNPSLDRNWTMGGLKSSINGRPLSAGSTSPVPRTDRNTFDPHAEETNHRSMFRDLDRGYSSGGEIENKKARNVLRKRDAVSANHSRQSSYHTETKRMSHAGVRRHSRFGSVDSIKDTVAAMASPAAKMYHGMGHFRNSSANETVSTASRSTDLTSPTVTKLEYDKKPSMKVVTSQGNNKSPANSSPKSAIAPSKSLSKPRMGLRAISDAVTGGEKSQAPKPIATSSPITESARQSSPRTGSTSPSGASQSLERESTDASSKGTSITPTGLTPTSGTRRKPKKETSAYIRGLEHKTPQEQMEGCDYSGWMKKKSSNIMTTWKSRLFVLRGRRLSYYYADTDTQERGLIDISSHRVLPADHDIITGFHATVTGAKSSPVSPATSHTPTLAAQDAAAQPESTLHKPTSPSMFIFKLVPPRNGLARAVNFTKPTIHYFAVENVIQGRLWMAALMKATIDRDETKPITTTYQQKTISLAKAKAMRHRPPALMNLDEKSENIEDAAKSDETGLNIQGLDFDEKGGEVEHKTDHIELKRAGSLGDTPSTVLAVEKTGLEERN